MDKEQQKNFKKKLLEEREEVIKTLERMDENEPNDSLQEYFGELSVYDNHPADIATETFEMEMNFNLKNNEECRLEEVDEALERIKEGSYGTCNTCGKDIAMERLEILPTASQCIECERGGVSIGKKMETRPIEEEVLYPPYGRTFMDGNEEYNGFDGEDTWQAVARNNKTDEHNMAIDWYDNNMYDENVSGTVEQVDNISNGYYMGQLEDEERKDIKDEKRR